MLCGSLHLVLFHLSIMLCGIVSDQQSSIDSRVLDSLEKSLDSAEEELATLKLDDLFKGLLLMQSKMKDWVASYQDELKILVDDVENIRQINETVPRDCFKKIKIEPTDV